MNTVTLVSIAAVSLFILYYMIEAWIDAGLAKDDPKYRPPSRLRRAFSALFAAFFDAVFVFVR